MARVTDMTHGRPIRLILLFSLPLMLGSVFQQLYTIVDTIIIGRGVGMQALASIGAADWINWLVLWGLQGFTQGFAILAAQEFGAGAYDRLRRVLAMIVKLSCWFGIAVTIISLLLVRPLLTLLRTDPAVFGGAQTYLYVQFGGSLIIIAYNMAAAVLRCLGDSRTPLLAILAASFANIALDLLFVMGFGWGIFGASFATVLAQLIAFLLCLRSLRRLPFVQLTKADWKTDPAILLHLCRLGIPTGLQMSMITLGGMVLQSVLNGFGVVFVAGYTAANNIFGFLYVTVNAVTQACMSFTSQNYGVGKWKRMERVLIDCLILSFAAMMVLGNGAYFFGPQLLHIYTSSDAVIKCGMEILLYTTVTYFLCGFMDLFPGALRGMGHSGVPMLLSIIGTVGTRIVWIYWIFPRHRSLAVLFISYPASWIITLAMQIVCYFYVRKMLYKKIANKK